MLPGSIAPGKLPPSPPVPSSCTFSEQTWALLRLGLRTKHGPRDQFSHLGFDDAGTSAQEEEVCSRPFQCPPCLAVSCLSPPCPRHPGPGSYLPSPLMPAEPLARHCSRSLSMGSVAVVSFFLAWTAISRSWRAVPAI